MAKRVVLDMNHIRQEISQGETPATLGLRYGVHPSTIYRQLGKVGYNIRSRSMGFMSDAGNDRVPPAPGFIDSPEVMPSGDGMPEPAYRPAYNTREARAMALSTSDGPKRIPGQMEMPKTVQEAVQQFNDFIGYDGKPPLLPSERPVKLNGDRKILLLNDIHAPYHNEEAIKQAVLEQAHDTDVLLLGGDLMDLFTVSRYEKFEQHYSTEEEFRSGKALLNYFASIFPKVRIIPGNHDERWKKYLITKRNVSPSDIVAMNYLIRQATGDENLDISDPIYCLTRDLPNVEVVQPVRKDFAKFTFFMQEGDLIVSHAEKFSRITGQAANVAAQWFVSNAKPMGLIKDFRVFAQCHTHQAGLHWGNFGIWTMECGCLSKTPDYAGGPKLMGAQRPSILGYSVFYQDSNGRTDMRRSRFIPIEG